MYLELLLRISYHESIQIEQCIYWTYKINTVREAVLRHWRNKVMIDDNPTSSNSGETSARS